MVEKSPEGALAHSPRPASLSCVHCKGLVSELTDLCPPKSSGLTSAYCGLCLHCGLMNYTMTGPDDKVQEAYRKLALDKLDRYKSRRPNPIACDTCHATLTDVTELPTEGLQGMSSAHVAPCAHCRKPTYVLVGDANVVQHMRAQMVAAGFMEPS